MINSAHQQLCFCIRKPFRGAAPWFSTSLCPSGVLWKFQKEAFLGVSSVVDLFYSAVGLFRVLYCIPSSALPKDVILAHFLTSVKQLVPVNFSVPWKSNWFVKSLKSSPKGMCSVTALQYYSKQRVRGFRPLSCRFLHDGTLRNTECVSDLKSCSATWTLEHELRREADMTRSLPCKSSSRDLLCHFLCAETLMPCRCLLLCCRADRWFRPALRSDFTRRQNQT